MRVGGLYMSDYFGLGGFFAGVTLLIFCGIASLVYHIASLDASITDSRNRLERSFPLGSMVSFSLDGRKGMVTGHRSRCVFVRTISRSTKTNASFLGADGYIEGSPYTLGCYKSFELSLIQEGYTNEQR